MEWSKLVFETIFPLKGGTFILKRGLRFSFSVDVPFTGVRKRLTYFFVPEILFFGNHFFAELRGNRNPFHPFAEIHKIVFELLPNFESWISAGLNL